MKSSMKWVLSLLMLVALLSLSACGNTDATNGGDGDANAGGQEKTTIVLGISSDLTEAAEAGRAALEAKGYTLDIQIYDDFVLPNTALVEGTIDANFFQHEPWLLLFNENNGTDLVMLTPKVIYSRWGLYSEKITSLADIPAGASVGVSDDPSNLERGLFLLQDNDLITLAEKPAVGEHFGVADIVENELNLNIVTVDWFATTSIFSDVDMVITPGYYYLESGGDPSTALCMDNRPEYAIGIVVDGANVNQQWAKDLVDAYTSPATRDAIDQAYKGSFGFPE